MNIFLSLVYELDISCKPHACPLQVCPVLPTDWPYLPVRAVVSKVNLYARIGKQRAQFQKSESETPTLWFFFKVGNMMKK